MFKCSKRNCGPFNKFSLSFPASLNCSAVPIMPRPDSVEHLTLLRECMNDSFPTANPLSFCSEASGTPPPRHPLSLPLVPAVILTISSRYRHEFLKRFGITVAFLATHSGLTRWQDFPQNIDRDGDDVRSVPHFHQLYNRAIDEIWYKRAVEQHYVDPRSFVYSVPFDVGGWSCLWYVCVWCESSCVVLQVQRRVFW